MTLVRRRWSFFEDADASGAVLRPDLLLAMARSWIVLAALFYLVDLSGQLHVGLTNGAGRPLGDDFINYWSGARLAWANGVASVYDWSAFHDFEQRVVGAPLDFYHYGYPPVGLLLTAPLALLPYIPALAAWLLTGWYAFYRALRTVLPGRAGLMLALAAPAVFVNAIGGQNGTWTAALLGGGLCVLPRRPVVAGVLFGLLAYKPHLAVLVPVALIAGREWRAFASAGITVLVLVAVSVLCFGAGAWIAYAHNLSDLRALILEDGTGVWHRMISVFVAARRLGAGVAWSYAAQAVATLIAGGVVAVAWGRRVSAPLRNAALILGTFLATPYLQDYDLVVGTFAIAWLLGAMALPVSLRLPGLVAGGLVLAAPVLAAPLAIATGLSFGPLFFCPALVVTAMSLAGPADQSRPRSSPASVTGNEQVSPRQT